MCSCEVFIRQRFKIGGVQENGHSDKVVVEEIIEGGEVFVSLFECGGGGEGGVNGGVWEGDVVFRGEGEEEGG